MDIPASPSCNSAVSPGWDDVRYAVVIARCGSVAGAARQLGVDQTTVARRLRALEACLGTPLFERRKGQLTPTPRGEELLTRGQRMEAEIAALCHLVSDRQTQVKGVVRITAVDTLASHYLARQLADLRSRYPELAIEINSALGTEGWIEVGAVDAGAVTELTYYSADVYISDPAYVRIRAKAGTANRSANFDNVTIAPYSAPTRTPYDAFLLQYNVTPGDPGTAPGEDLDGDFHSNTNEFNAATNPYDPASHP